MSLIEKILGDSCLDPFAIEMVRYQLQTGGKRIRPTIVLGVHRALGGRDANALPLAGAVEIIHNASLVHDDIQDQDEQRRGKETAWKRYSTNQAINLGDLLFTLAFEVFMRSRMAEKTKMELIKLAMKAVSELVNGQVREIQYRDRGNVTVEEYLGMVEGKTGSLFRLASKGAFVITENGSENWGRDFDRLGTHIGNMFQIRDDIIDIFGLKEGREAGSDILEGKVSILTCVSLSRLDENERRALLDLLAIPRDAKDRRIVENVTGIYRRTGAFREAYSIYEREGEKAFSMPVMKDNKMLGGFISEVMDSLSSSLKDLSVNF